MGKEYVSFQRTETWKEVSWIVLRNEQELRAERGDWSVVEIPLLCAASLRSRPVPPAEDQETRFELFVCL